jgi:hypothetical protein
MRPGQPWGDVVRVLNRATGMSWTPERLRRTVRRLAAEKIVESELLDPAPRKPPGRAGGRHRVRGAGPHPAADRQATRRDARAHAARRNPLARPIGPPPVAAGRAPWAARRPLPCRSLGRTGVIVGSGPLAGVRRLVRQSPIQRGSVATSLTTAPPNREGHSEVAKSNRQWRPLTLRVAERCSQPIFLLTRA